MAEDNASAQSASRFDDRSFCKLCGEQFNHNFVTIASYDGHVVEVLPIIGTNCTEPLVTQAEEWLDRKLTADEVEKIKEHHRLFVKAGNQMLAFQARLVGKCQR